MLSRRAVMGAGALALAAPMVRAQSAADGVAEAFLAVQGLPGVSWAVRRASGRVIQGAAGFADPDAGEWMTPDHRLRIASISKTITAAMILSLEAEEKLWVGYQPFAPDGVLRRMVDESLPWLPVLELMTLDHMLTHTSGGWRNDGGQDPFFQPADLALDLEPLIRKALAEQAPDNMPGTVYAYSNFGYSLLSRIIEIATLTDCTSAVRSWLADPVGASSFALGGDTRADRLSGEAVYITSSGFDPYSLRVSRLDSLGGWVVAAADLLAILAGFDGHGNETVAASIAGRMAVPGTADGNYGRGLLTSRSHGNRWHNGRLPGTTSIAVMLQGGDLICALANGRTEVSGAAIETLVFDVYRAAIG
jgi:CubicO group peptidase (beta-lactamase class C family)